MSPSSPTDGVGAGQLCSVHSSALNLGTGLGGLTPGQALRADTGGEQGPAATAQQVLLLTPLPEQEGGHPGGVSGPVKGGARMCDRHVCYA